MLHPSSVTIYPNIANFDGLLNPEDASYLTVCLPGSSGDLLSTIGGTATDDLNTLNDAVVGMDDWDNTESTNTINTAWGLLYE